MTVATPTPEPGQVYKDEDGRLALYIRTETRPGRSVDTGADVDTPEHLFVVAMPEKRTFATWWVRADKPLPESLRLVLDEGMRERLARMEARLREVEAEREALVATMKRAVALAPAHRAELARTYRAVREGGRR